MDAKSTWKRALSHNVVTNSYCWSARYEIRAASSEDCVFVPPNFYDVTAT